MGPDAHSAFERMSSGKTADAKKSHKNFIFINKTFAKDTGLRIATSAWHKWHLHLLKSRMFLVFIYAEETEHTEKSSNCTGKVQHTHTKRKRKCRPLLRPKFYVKLGFRKVKAQRMSSSKTSWRRALSEWLGRSLLFLHCSDINKPNTVSGFSPGQPENSVGHMLRMWSSQL